MSDNDSFKLPPEVLQRLTRRSDTRGLIQLTAHLAALLLAGIGVHSSRDSLWLLLTLPAYGAVLIFLFAALHETIHYTAFKTGWLNNLVAAPVGFLLLTPFQYFRAFHYLHHRHTQNPALDPELIDMKPLIDKRYWWYLTGLPTWWQSLVSIWRHAQGQVDESYIEARHHATIVNEARVHLAGYALLLLFGIVTSSAALWWYWVLPALLAQPLLRLYLLPEHSGCDLNDNMLENSRTTYTTPLLNFLAWNMPYHAEHHYLASVPFHALPALHAYTGQRVKHKGDGYFQVNREIAG
ncbi:MAG: fatty acid desaturase [Gammaproteobacteria bacterium]|nr:fatty acid desaturase [Gammaproteobacteria bacterium]MDH3534726.1 fatty acid desaturase [Gammaproteobacteria bacterium]